MRFMLLFHDVDHPEQDDAAVERMYRRCEAWFAEHGAAGRIRGGFHFEAAKSARSIVRGAPEQVVQGPPPGLPLHVGGCAVLECSDIDEALDVARAWPGTGSVLEVRPLAS